MKAHVKFAIIVIAVLHTTVSALDVVEKYTRYCTAKQTYKFPSYTAYLSLMVSPIGTNLHGLIRQPGENYPGDYFWPPNALLSSNPEDDAYNTPLNEGDRSQVEEFLKRYFAGRFADSAIVASLQGYYYEFRSGSYEFKTPPRREFYTMLTEGDTVYVISGLFGKFMSFYRAVPGDFKLTPSELMGEVDKLSSIAQGLGVRDADFTKRDDPDNYFLQYIDRDALVRIRNYKLEAVLPPSDPDSKTPRMYNLIEITKIVDSSIIPTGR